MCLKESLRMNSPVPNIARRLTKDVALPDGNVAPAGKSLLMLTNSEVWEKMRILIMMRKEFHMYPLNVMVQETILFLILVVFESKTE